MDLIIGWDFDKKLDSLEVKSSSADVITLRWIAGDFDNGGIIIKSE